MSDLRDDLLKKAANDSAVSDDVFRVLRAALTGEPFEWESSTPEDLSAWTTCDGCGRAMTEDQAERAQCSFLVRCAGCMAEHVRGCIACGAE